MTLRHVIKRDRVMAGDEHRRAEAKGASAQPARGVRLVELEPGRYAIEHTCRCGEVSVIEVETASAAPPRETES